MLLGGLCCQQIPGVSTSWCLMQLVSGCQVQFLTCCDYFLNNMKERKATVVEWKIRTAITDEGKRPNTFFFDSDRNSSSFAEQQNYQAHGNISLETFAVMSSLLLKYFLSPYLVALSRYFPVNLPSCFFEPLYVFQYPQYFMGRHFIAQLHFVQ